MISAAELVGSIGVFLLLVAFLLNLIGRLRNDRIPYQLLNFAGAAIACYASVMIGFRPFVVLEGAWSLIALAGIIHALASGRLLAESR
ncbi:MAG: CBU_0592 family membrane protein [Candidatus Binataceae bacterium]